MMTSLPVTKDDLLKLSELLERQVRLTEAMRFSTDAGPSSRADLLEYSQWAGALLTKVQAKLSEPQTHESPFYSAGGKL
jgi:hypothetical protein